MAVLNIDKTDAVATVTLNRPEARNALSPELVVRLSDCWKALREDAAVRAVILTGAPGSTFCAGFDLAKSIPLLTGARQPADHWDEAFLRDSTLAGQACLRDRHLGKPLIVAANGHAIAGGMELLRAGDLRLATTGALLGLSEVRIGLIPAMGGTATLLRHMPRSLAAELLLTGAPISAERALAAGFLNFVTAPDQVVPKALELARAVAGNAPLAVSAAHELLHSSFDMTEIEALAREAELGVRLARTQDAVEGPRAFLEKRSPHFIGR
jgi:enoyl-CoA hydratase